MQAAAAASLKNADGNDQKAGKYPYTPMAAPERSTMDSDRLRSRPWLTISKSAPASKDRAVCHLRSPDQSECHPFTSIEGNAARTGIAVKKVTCNTLPLESFCTIFGSQNPNP